MTTDPYCPPPPYTPADPLTPVTTQAPASPLRLRGGDGQIPAYSPNNPDEPVVEESPTFTDSASPQFSSAAAYFEERGLRNDTHDNASHHQLFISPADRAEDIASIPLCWRNRTSDLTQADMSTFANFLLPPGPNTRLPLKLRTDLARDEKAPLSPTDTESSDERQARMSLVVAEWNEAFFYPRGLVVELNFVPRHAPHAARGLDPICHSCVTANNSASRYATQGSIQPVQPPMLHGMAVPPPPPRMFHDAAMFPHGPLSIPPFPHGPATWLNGLPPNAPYGRRPFGLGYLRDGIERFANGGGWSRGRGQGCGEFFARRGGLHSYAYGHRDFHHRRRSGSSDSSSSSSSESDHDHHHAGRHAGRHRGRGRGGDCKEALGTRREGHHRRRGRSSSTSSSSSSSSDSSMDSISSRDVRGLGLQDVIRGIAAVKLDKKGKKFGLKMDPKGNKMNAKMAVKELKTELREMKRQNVNGGREIAKDEKRAVKKELKGLKKDLKHQWREIKREKRGLKREERDRRRDRNRDGRDRGRCGERRSRGWERAEDRAWDGNGLERAQTEGQVTGVTGVHDENHVELAKDVKV